MNSQALGQDSATIRRTRADSVGAFIGTSLYALDFYREKAKSDFLLWKDVWLKETAHISDPAAIFENFAYQEIINLGTVAIPFIVDDLRATNNHWFFALHELTGINPILPEHAGDLQSMRQDWLGWAAVNNL